MELKWKHALPLSHRENQLPSHHLHDRYDLPIQYQLLQKNISLDSLGKRSRSWGVCVPDGTAGRNSCSSRTALLGVVEATCVFPQERHAPRLPGNIWLDESGNRTLSAVITG